MRVYMHFVLLLLAWQEFARAFVKDLSRTQEKRLASWTPEDKQNLWELSGQVEGDMVFAPQLFNGLIATRYHWPGNKIPYEIDSVFSAQQKTTIHNTIKEFGRISCVQVINKTTEIDYVYVTGLASGCWSYVGRIGGRQDLNLQLNGCVYTGTIIHEFLHAAGFRHQHDSTDRDDYVDIFWANICDGYASSFDKYNSSVITSFGQPYDYNSVMHYSTHAFSCNNLPTIQPKNRSISIGQRDGFSIIDIVKLNLMYSCY